MLRQRVVGYRDRVRSELHEAFSQDHPPQWIAISFSIGIFVTALPTLGSGLLVLAAIGYRFAWSNTIALFAAVAVLNPVAKWGVYLASFGLGSLLLGPVEGVSRSEIGLDAGREVVVRLLVGNSIIAVVFAVVGYALALRGVYALRRYAN